MNKFRFKIKKLSGFIRFSEDKAFTLIELLVVIAIIGTLSTIAFISLSGANDSAEDSKKIANIRSIQNALLQYKLEKGGYPEVKSATAGDANKCYAGDDAKNGLGDVLGDYLPGFKWSDAEYFYGSDVAKATLAGTATEYVIGVKLSGENDVLNSDVDEATATPATDPIVKHADLFGSTYVDNTNGCKCDDAPGRNRILCKQLKTQKLN